MPKPTIPRFEPEVVQAGVNKRRGDDEKVATTAADCIDAHGVILSSRYRKAHELEKMTRMVEGLDADLRPLVESIWCDSQAQACYTVLLNTCSQEQADEIGRQLEVASGGHNGMYISGPNGVSADRDPEWFEPSDFDDDVQ